MLAVSNAPSSFRSKPFPDTSKSSEARSKLVLIGNTNAMPRAYELFGVRGRDFFRKWREPCKDFFRHVAEEFPDEYPRLLLPDYLELHDLTFAAEIAGCLKDSVAVRSALIPLLSHTNDVVREGALYGLEPHIDESVRVKLREVAKNDSRKEIREIAAELLEE